MMKRVKIEPGLLSLFRLGNIFWLAIYIPGLSFLVLASSKSIRPLEIFGALNAVIMLLYLYSGRLQRRVGRLYLPVGLFVASLGGVMAQWFEMIWRIHSDVPPESVYVGEGYLAGALFVPLIIVSAQYSFRGTLAFTLGAIMLQVGSLLLLVPFGGAPVSKIFGGIIGLAIIFPAVGFVVVKFVDSQKTIRQILTKRNIKLVRYATTVERLTISHERNRMARELHDTLAHTLSGVSVQLEALSTQLDSDPDGAKQTLINVQGLTRNGLQEVRRALHALRASPLEDLGLGLAMRHLVESMNERSGMEITLEIAADLEGVRPEVEQSIYRIAEEALNNSVRHANARHIAVSLLRDEPEIQLTITDDGIGFEPETEAQNRHFGIIGMRERAMLVNGQLDINSEPGKGATVRLIVGE